MNLTTIKNIEAAASLISNAEAVLIYAGAGMSVDSGLEQYRGNDGLWTKHLDIEGHQIKYIDLMTHMAFDETPEKAWALAVSLMKKYEETVPHQGYNQLLELLKNKDYFVMTSNCDNQFEKAGFDTKRIYECHGSLKYMQCMDILERDTWPTPNIEIDMEKFAVKELPKCPKCGGNCRPNIYLFGDWFWVNTKSTSQLIKYIKWTKEATTKYTNIIAIEIGAGNTIATIRQASEKFVQDKYPLIRINPYDCSVKLPKHLAIEMGAKSAMEEISKLIFFRDKFGNL